MSISDQVVLDILVDKSIYSLSMTQRSAHRFSDIFFVEISDKQSHFGVRLTSRSGKAVALDTAARFHTTLLDESLRETILQDTRAIRDTLIAVAFGNARPKSDAGTP